MTILLLGCVCVGGFSADIDDGLEILRSFSPCPYSIDSEYFLDGGTYALKLSKKDGTFYWICIDGQNIEYNIERELTESQREFIDEERKQKVYLGAIHPQEGGTVLPFKGKEEKELISIIKKWKHCSIENLEYLDHFSDRLAEERLRKIELKIPNKSVERNE